LRDPVKLSSGAVIAGRYRLERLLGEGGMGAVWSALHTLTEKRVALKFLKAAEQPELVRRFVREARAASAVRHPNVIGIHDVLTLEDGMPCMVMDLLEGESLGQRLERTGPVPPHELAAIMVPVLSAVGAAHALGIVHRDLKPDNVFLSRQGDGSLAPMVLDFGICKLISPESGLREGSTLTETGAVMGTPFYMAPEQVFGEPDVDARADVWALGVMIYECASGTRPVRGENMGQLIKHILSGSIRPLQEVAPQVAPELARTVDRMLIQDRRDRTPDLREPFQILQALTAVSAQSFGAATTMRVVHSEPPPAAAMVRPSSPLEATSAGKPVTANVQTRAAAKPWRSVAGAVALLALAAVGAAQLLRHGGGARPPPSRPSAATTTTLPITPSTPAAPRVEEHGVAELAARAAASASAASSSAVHARHKAAAPRAASAPSATPRTLAGGVHGQVPF
jgi:serine/threonine protein kinase